MIIATASVEGQCEVIWTAHGARHTVEYGHDVTKDVSERDACAAFFSCVAHARQCAGLDDVEPESSSELITVEYFGHAVRVPEWANYLACDADGVLYAYDVEPEMSIDSWCCGPDGYRRIEHSYGTGPCPFWHESLIEL
jgi:hypothetical protein